MAKKKPASGKRIASLKGKRMAKTQEGQQAWTEAQIQQNLLQKKIIGLPKGIA